MDEIKQFVKERNEALFSLNREKIEAYMIKYDVCDPKSLPDFLFWAVVYKAITGIKDAPWQMRNKAHIWLSDNGFHALS